MRLFAVWGDYAMAVVAARDSGEARRVVLHRYQGNYPFRKEDIRVVPLGVGMPAEPKVVAAYQS